MNYYGIKLSKWHGDFFPLWSAFNKNLNLFCALAVISCASLMEKMCMHTHNTWSHMSVCARTRTSISIFLLDNEHVILIEIMVQRLGRVVSVSARSETSPSHELRGDRLGQESEFTRPIHGRIGRDLAELIESTPILSRVSSKRIFTRDERV